MRERPNIVVFMADQLRADAVGAFGNPVAHTPAVDALAARGTRFRRAYAQHSVCAQSRVSMLTGWYPHVAGHRTLSNLLKPWEPNLLRLLRDGGYTVASPGHRGDAFAPGVLDASADVHGFTVRPDPEAMLDYFVRSPHPPGHKYFDAFYFGRRGGDGPVLDFDEATVRTAEAWLAGSPPEPWALFVNLMFPHPPFLVEEPWFSLHDRAGVPAPVTADLATKPRFMRALSEACGLGRLDAGDWAEIVATYYGMVSRVDHHLGRLVEAVDRAGAADRTAVVFCSDHGEYLGDFGLVEKWPSGLDDCLVRDPLVVHVPGAPGGVDTDALVEMVDLLPTLLELAGVEPAHTHFGRSLLPLVAGTAAGHRDAVFSEGGFVAGEERVLEPLLPGTVYEHKTRLEHDDITLAGRAVAVRTAEWTYVHRLYEAGELYDRRADPGEVTNLHGRPEHAAMEAELRSRVLDWLIATSDVVPWARDPRMDPEVQRSLFAPGP